MKKYRKKSVHEFLMKVQSIAKIGLLYSKDPYALENYEELNTLSKSFLEEENDLTLDRPNVFPKTIYPTPNVSVRVLIFNEKDELLMVKEKVDGGFTIPGGWADIFESPAEAAMKECLQETGADVTLTRLVGIYDFHFRAHGEVTSQYAIVFTGRIKQFVQPFGHEVTHVGFYPLNKLPKPISHKVDIEDLKRMIRHAKEGVTHFE